MANVCSLRPLNLRTNSDELVHLASSAILGAMNPRWERFDQLPSLNRLPHYEGMT